MLEKNDRVLKNFWNAQKTWASARKNVDRAPKMENFAKMNHVCSKSNAAPLPRCYMHRIVQAKIANDIKWTLG